MLNTDAFTITALACSDKAKAVPRPPWTRINAMSSLSRTRQTSGSDLEVSRPPTREVYAYVSPWFSTDNTETAKGDHFDPTCYLDHRLVRRLLPPGRASTYYEPELSDIADDLYDTGYFTEPLR